MSLITNSQSGPNQIIVEQKQNDAKMDADREETDSSDNESYKPSINQIMDEYLDNDINSVMNESITSDSDELDLLLYESKIPVELVLGQYENFAPTKRAMSPNSNINDVRGKRRPGQYYSREYDDSSLDSQGFIFTFHQPKMVRIGPTFQANVPTRPDPSSTIKFSSEDEILYDPYDPQRPSYESFCEILKTRFPDLSSKDDNLMKFYTKHNGDAKAAMRDNGSLEAIEVEQSASLCDWTEEECEMFTKAMIQHTKNFDLIRYHTFPTKSKKEIVHFYYLWKKSPFYADYLNRRLLAKASIYRYLSDDFIAKVSPNSTEITPSTMPSSLENDRPELPNVNPNDIQPDNIS